MALLDTKGGEYYWLIATAVDPERRVVIGRREGKRWLIDGQLYTDGPGIWPFRHVERPNVSAIYNAQKESDEWADLLHEKRKSASR